MTIEIERSETYGRMQIFRTAYLANDQQEYFQALFRHTADILKQAIFGIARECEAGAYSYRSVAGALEELGRLPKEGDRIRIVYFRWLEIEENVDPHHPYRWNDILSELRFEFEAGK